MSAKKQTAAIWYPPSQVDDEPVVVTELNPPLLVAAREGNVDKCARILHATPHAIHVQDRQGNTALHAAVGDNRHAVVQLLCSAPGVDVDKVNALHQSPLLLISMFNFVNNSVPLARLLLEHGATASKKDAEGRSAMHWSSTHNNYEMIGVLLAGGGGLDDVNDKGETPLFCACKEGSMRAVRCLLFAGASFSIDDQLSRTPRMIAVEHGHKDIVKALDIKAIEADLMKGS